MTDYESLRQWATPAQAEKLDALKKHGSGKCAAKSLGVHERNFWRSLKRLRDAAARQGYSPEHDMTRTAPDGFHVKGTSTYYDADGNPAAQWVKTSIDQERQEEIMREAVEALSNRMPEGPRATGYCHECGEDLVDAMLDDILPLEIASVTASHRDWLISVTERRWCDAECRDMWEKRNA